MFKWFKRKVAEEVANVDEDIELSENLSDSEFNYLISLLQKDDLILDSAFDSTFYTLKSGDIWFSVMSNYDGSVRVLVGLNTIVIKGSQSKIMHNHCNIAADRIGKNVKLNSQSKARKKLQELMNG